LKNAPFIDVQDIRRTFQFDDNGKKIRLNDKVLNNDCGDGHSKPLTWMIEFLILPVKTTFMSISNPEVQPQDLINGGEVMAEEKVGEVVKYFVKPSVAAIHITEGELRVGDTIKFSGHTTEFADVVQSMEVDNKAVQKAVAGDSVGLKVSDRVRSGDEVFKIVAD
jgi:putative protease